MTHAEALKVAIERLRALSRPGHLVPVDEKNAEAAARLERLVPFVQETGNMVRIMAHFEREESGKYGQVFRDWLAAYRALSPEETTKP